MTRRRWEIVLPFEKGRLPLSLNYRQTPHQHARIVAEVREMAGRLAIAHRVGRHPRVRVALHVLPAVSRTRDVENPVPTLKACCDGLVDAGVVADDDPYRMDKLMPIIHLPEPGQPPRCWLEIEALPAVEGAPPAKAQPKPAAAKRKAPAKRRAPRPRGSWPVDAPAAEAPAVSEWAARVAANDPRRRGRSTPA